MSESSRGGEQDQPRMLLFQSIESEPPSKAKWLKEHRVRAAIEDEMAQETDRISRPGTDDAGNLGMPGTSCPAGR